MIVTPADLRRDFPEFADAAKYPEPMVQFWLNLAVLSLPELRWGDWWAIGQELFAAHQLVVAANNIKVAGRGNTPGVVSGPVASKSVDKVSVSYDAGAVALTDGGFWNLTTYGIQFLQMARMVGAGGVQL